LVKERLITGERRHRLSAVAQDPDAELLDRLRAGDEQAFVVLVGRYREAMLRLAAGYVPSRAVAEEVVQDTWVGVLRGLGGFEGRSSVRTWVFRILVNRARTAGTRERRSVAVGDMEPVVDRSRFDGTGHWISPPEVWVEQIHDRLVAAKMADRIRSAVVDLPARQCEVVTLRDIEGLSSDEVCGVLEISEANQRVLLHRGRSKLRQILETEFGRA
jgi:RNA polymerase sigma-70 factor, ECF subfamily